MALQNLKTNNLLKEINFQDIQIDFQEINNGTQRLFKLQYDNQKRQFITNFTLVFNNEIFNTQISDVSLGRSQTAFQFQISRNEIEIYTVFMAEKFSISIITKQLDHFKMRIYGYDLNRSPTASQVINLLNCLNFFKKQNKEEERIETEIMLGLSLISARRFLQSAEIFKNISKSFQEKSQKQKGQFSLSQPFNNIFNINYDQNMIQAAKYQLLSADAIKQLSMVNEKVYSYLKASQLFQNDQVEIKVTSNYDIQTALANHGSQLCKFLIKSCFDKAEAVKIAALKGIEFLFENSSFVLISHLPTILKTFLITHPFHDDSYENEQVLIPLKNPIKIFLNPNLSDEQIIKVRVDLINLLLENYIYLIPNVSFQILMEIFLDIIQQNMFLHDLTQEIRVYLIRIADKIVEQCQGDIEIDINFCSQLFILMNKNSYAQKLWETIKQKYLPYLTSYNIQEYLQWINEKVMISLEQKKPIQNYLIDLTKIIAQNQNKSENQIQIMVKYTITILESSLSENGNLELFQKSWSILNDLDKDIGEKVAFQILEKVIQFIKEYSPNIQTLKVLKTILQNIDVQNQQYKEFLYKFLLQYCNAISHSIHDETFEVFDLLVEKIDDQFDIKMIQQCILALIDQFTVKGRAYHNSLKKIILIILNQNHIQLFEHCIQFCLIQNPEPYYNLIKIDTKQNNQIFEVFIEKLNFLQQLFQEIKERHVLYLLENIDKVHIQNLFNSQNSNIRQKAFYIISTVLESFNKEQQFQDNNCLSLFENIAFEYLNISLNYFNHQKFAAITLITLKNLLKLRPDDHQYNEENIKEFTQIIQKLVNQFNDKNLNLYLKKLTLSIIGQIYKINMINSTFQEQLIQNLNNLIQLQTKNKDYFSRFASIYLIGIFCGLAKETYDSNFFKTQSQLIQPKIWSQIRCYLNDWNQQNKKAANILISLYEQDDKEIQIQEFQNEFMIDLDLEKYEPQSTDMSIENEQESLQQSMQQEIKQFYKQQPVEEDLDFEDLGIIEIDDEEWNEEYLEEIQKYQICKKRPKSRLKSSKTLKEAQIEQTDDFEHQDYQSPLRPQNQLLRPLTPPIKKQNSENESEAIFELNPELYCKLAAQWVKQKKVNENQKKQKRKVRPFSAKYKQRHDNYEIKRKDSVELIEQLSSSSSNSLQYPMENIQKNIEWEQKDRIDLQKQDDYEDIQIDNGSGPESVEQISDSVEEKKNDNFEQQLKNEIFDNNFFQQKNQKGKTEQIKLRPKSPKYSNKNAACKTQNQSQKKHNIYQQILEKKKDIDKKSKIQEMINSQYKKDSKKLFSTQLYQSLGSEQKKNALQLSANISNASNSKNFYQKKDK